ncbi:hypothetical protein GGF46_003359 [Coemansia sp. RSA 552]|nr:hypothetical protein GGF46_003359 [Coemansia sp. RSA 552]
MDGSLRPEVDPVLRTALGREADRGFVVEIEELARDFLLNTTALRRLHFPRQNSYRRLLLHKLADYYSLVHVVVGRQKDEVAFYRPDQEVALPPSLDSCVPMADPLEDPVSFTHMLVRKPRPEDPGTRIPQAPRVPPAEMQRAGKSVAQRQAEYERARAAIFQDQVPVDAAGQR